MFSKFQQEQNSLFERKSEGKLGTAHIKVCIQWEKIPQVLWVTQSPQKGYLPETHSNLLGAVTYGMAKEL